MNLQHDHEAIFCVVDEHAITVPQNPKELAENTLNVAMLYLACGIDPKKSIIFVQSHVPAHTELAWILNTMTPLGELERMTQFKDKARDQEKKTGVLSGLLAYPVLMAADILLYKADIVPVGEDQKQHIELTRSLAERFNNRYGNTFTIPEPVISEYTARIMALDDPQIKMSKSASSAYSYISLLDTPDMITKKIKSAVTDSESEIIFNKEKRPAISNLIAIYHAFTEKPISDIEKEFEGMGYAEFKTALAELLIGKLSPIQKRYSELSKNKKEVVRILREGARNAGVIAEQTLSEVKQKVGFLI